MQFMFNFIQVKKKKGKFGDFLGFWVLCVCQFQSVIDDFRDEIYQLSFSCERNCLFSLLCSRSQFCDSQF